MHIESELYKAFTASGFTPDASQSNVITLLQKLSDHLEAGIAAKHLQKSIYLWGGVGRGKTLLMDVFFSKVAVDKKLRLHFHRLMLEVHHELQNSPPCADVLDKVAANFADRYQLICLDEFQIMDIGNAMVLYGLIKSLLERGVILVTTSNRHPDELYLGGVDREKIQPTINLIKNNADVFHLSGDIDYRLIHGQLSKDNYFHFPHDENTDEQLSTYFGTVSEGVAQSDTEILIQRRSIKVRRVSENSVWFDFNEICDGPRATNDYIEIAQRFAVVIVSALPKLSEDLESPARRFLNLVDELYDRRIHFVLSSYASMDSIYEGERLIFEFQRAVSRLHEMQSAIYFKLPGLTATVMHPRF